MTRRIFKYEIPLEPSSRISLPFGATILHLDVQNDRPYIWAAVDPEAQLAECGVTIAVTGGDEPSGQYLGSFLNQSGSFVGHVYVERAEVHNA